MAPRPSPQTERVVNLFEHLAGDGSRGMAGMTLAQVSRHLSVHKASCHSMLSELLRAGWLLRDPVRKTYHLGPALAPDRPYEVSHIDSPILEDGSRIALMLSLVPSAEPMSGAAVTQLGAQLSATTHRLSHALAEEPSGPTG